MPPFFTPPTICRAPPRLVARQCHFHHHVLHPSRRAFRSSTWLRGPDASMARKNHYERLNVQPNASKAEIKKSFYSLSKTHHPDANRADPNASQTFSLISESYTVLSDSSRRAIYDRDVMQLYTQHHQNNPQHGRKGSYHSTSQAGGRPASGLSRRRSTFRGPPPSFYRNGGWGAQSDKRQKAHQESTAAGNEAGPGPEQSPFGGMGPGSDPFGHQQEVPHFDKQSHKRTHENEDQRRWQRQRRAVDEDDVEFEPQTSLGGHFMIVAGILGITFLAPLVYLQFLRVGRKKKDKSKQT